MVIKRTHTGAELLGFTVTYESKEIRDHIEELLKTNEELEIFPKYSYEILKSNFHGQVAKIILNPIMISNNLEEPKTHYTKEEIEKEVEERVKFKMNELLTGLMNRSKINWQSAFHTMNPKYQHYMEAQKEMVGMFNKELEMQFPYEFSEKRNKENRITMDKVIQNIIDRFKLRGRYPGHELNSVLYNILKELQK